MASIVEVLQKAQQLHVQGDLDKARQIYDAVLGKTKNEPYVLYSLGTLYSQMGWNGTGMHLLMRAIDETPEKIEDPKTGDMVQPEWISQAWMNLGVCYKREGHDEDAEKCYEKSLEYQPRQVESLSNLSGLYINRGEPEKGLVWAERALEIEPSNAQAAHHKGMLLLEAERWEEGWKWHENRTRILEYNPRNFAGSKWHGQKVKHLVIHGEQGIGDEIMFSAWIPVIQSLGLASHITVECTPRLIPIFERSYGVECFATPDEIKSKYKVKHWISLASLPFVMGMRGNITHEGYIKPLLDRVQHWKDQFPGFRVGVSWRGGTKQTHDHLRNFPIEWWNPLFDGPNTMRFISLQYGSWESERQKAGLLRADWESFDDHLALVAACDVVISVCNTTVHMAGATNTPCFTLVPHGAAWRYGTKSKRMIWYPSVRLYRQEKGGKWHDVIRRIKDDLSKLPKDESGNALRETILRDVRKDVGEGGFNIMHPQEIQHDPGLRMREDDSIKRVAEAKSSDFGYRLRSSNTGQRPEEIL